MCTTWGSVSAGCVTSGSAVLMSCVVLAESGDAPGVDVTHKEVKRDTAGRRPRESDTTQSTAKVTHLHCYTLTDILPEVTQLVGMKIPNTELAGFNNLWVWQMTRSSLPQQERPGWEQRGRKEPQSVPQVKYKTRIGGDGALKWNHDTVNPSTAERLHHHASTVWDGSNNLLSDVQ